MFAAGLRCGDDIVVYVPIASLRFQLSMSLTSAGVGALSDEMSGSRGEARGFMEPSAILPS